MTARALSPATAAATASAGQIISPLRLSHLGWVGAGREPTLRLLVIQLPVFYGSGLLGAESERPSLGLANPSLRSQPPPRSPPPTKPSCCGDQRLFPSFVFKLICKSFLHLLPAENMNTRRVYLTPSLALPVSLPPHLSSVSLYFYYTLIAFFPPAFEIDFLSFLPLFRT